MAKIKLVFKWVFRVALLLIAALLLGMEVLDRYISADKGAAWIYRNVPREVSIMRTDEGLRYLSMGDADKPALVMVHGAPGTIFDFVAFAKQEALYDKFRLLIPERPGYGADRKAEPSIEKQAVRLNKMLEKESLPAYLFGHSYGAPVVVAMGALAPEKCKRLIPVSGQFDPDNEQTMYISYVVRFGIFKYLLPRMLWVSNVEKLTHPAAQRAILALYAKVQTPTDVIHGDADTLVDYENSPWLVNNYLGRFGKLITMAGKDHPVHFTEVPYFVDYLLALD